MPFCEPHARPRGGRQARDQTIEIGFVNSGHVCWDNFNCRTVFLGGEFGSNVRLTFYRNLASGLEMRSGKLWREARTTTRRRKILVSGLEHLHILLRPIADIEIDSSPLKVVCASCSSFSMNVRAPTLTRLTPRSTTCIYVCENMGEHLQRKDTGVCKYM